MKYHNRRIKKSFYEFHPSLGSECHLIQVVTFSSVTLRT